MDKMDHAGGIKEELQITDCGEEYVESTTQFINCRRGDGTITSVAMKDEQEDQVTELHSLGVIQNSCDVVKQEPRDEVLYDLQDQGLIDDLFALPLSGVPMFHTVKTESTALATLQTITLDQEEGTSKGDLEDEVQRVKQESDFELAFTDVDRDLVLEDNTQTDPLAMATSHVKDWNLLHKGLLMIEGHGEEITPTYSTLKNIKYYYKCETCASEFKHSYELRVHSTTHNPENGLQCEECDFRCKFKSELARHMPTHTGLRIFKCRECLKPFKRSNELTRHLASHSNEKRFECDVCGFQCRYKVNLARHIMSHTVVRLYSCQVCGKLLKSTHYLKKHLMCHTSEKSITCNVCDKKFKCSAYLKHHMHIHTSPKTFQCKECEKKFRRSADLKRHVLIHSTAKSTVCHICDKRFKRQVYLEQHMLTHSRLQVVQCKECGQQLKQSRYLTQHLKRTCRKNKSSNLDILHNT